MPASAAPFGLVPIKHVFGHTNFEVTWLPMTANSATAIFLGDLVSLGSGAVAAATATPTTTRSANTPVGVCAGVRYVDTNGRQQWAKFLPANAITNLGYTNVEIGVCRDPFIIYRVQSSGATTAASIGRNAPLANFGGSTTTGLSTIHLLHASIADTATLAVRIVGVDPATVGDTYTNVDVIFVPGVHQLTNATGA